MAQMHLTPQRVAGLLRMSGARERTRWHAGFEVHDGKDGITVVWSTRKGLCPPAEQRVAYLMAMREALLSHAYVTVVGSHHADGAPVSLLVTPRDHAYGEVMHTGVTELVNMFDVAHA